VVGQKSIPRLLFIDDVLCFTNGLTSNAEALRNALDLFGSATWMVINMEKSYMLLNEIPSTTKQKIHDILTFPNKDILSGFKYLWFNLKPNNYGEHG
jgi:hypothetical protein